MKHGYTRKQIEQNPQLILKYLDELTRWHAINEFLNGTAKISKENPYDKNAIDNIFKMSYKGITSMKCHLKKYCPEVIKYIEQHTKFIDVNIERVNVKAYKVGFIARLYCILNGITSIPICIECGKPLKNFKVVRTNMKHKIFCSLKCANSSPLTIFKKTTSYCNRSDEEKHRTDIKKRKTLTDKYGVPNFMNSCYFKKKKHDYIVANGGIDNVSQLKDVRQKVVTTNLKRYGCTCNLANKHLVELKKKTYLENFGTNHPMKNIAFKDDFFSLFEEKHGVKNPFLLESVMYNNKVVALKRRIAAILNNDYVTPLFHLDENTELKLFDFQYWWQCKECGHVFAAQLFGFNVKTGRITRCPFCTRLGSCNHSIIEYQVFQFLKDRFPNITMFHDFNAINRHIIPPYELDIFIPDKNIAIEIDGVFWHSIEFSEKYKHIRDDNVQLKKTNLCEEKKIHLIHIYEDEWIFRRPQIEVLLYNIITNTPIEVNSDLEFIMLPHDKYPTWAHVQGYMFDHLTLPTITDRLNVKDKCYHVYDCGQLVYKKT